MKRNWIWSGLLTLVLTASAFAAPSYDSKDWQSFMEGKSTTVPAGVPAGKGMVGTWNGKGFWADKGLVDIQDAMDATSFEGVVISDTAKTGKRYYTGETGKAFLNALVAEMRKLSKDQKLEIPVAYLSYQGGGVPMRMMDLPGQTVSLGIYVRNKAGKAEPMANGSYRSGHVASSIHLPQHDRHEAFVKLTEPKKQSYQAMDEKTLCNALREDRKSLSQANANHIKQAQDIFELEDQIESELAAELDALSPEERQARIREEMMNRLAPDASGQKALPKDALELDDEKTWLMLEAALSQKEVPVSRISLSADLRVRLIAYASNHKRPQAVMDRLIEVSQDSMYASAITIHLGCSLRDRFMGCSVRDDATDILVNARAKTMLKAAENLTGDAQKQVLTMVWLSGADRIYAETDALSQKLNPRDNKDARSLLNKIRMNQRVDASELAAICKAQTEAGNNHSASALIGNRATRMPFFSIPQYLMIPDEMAKLPGALAGMDENCREQFVRASMHITTMLHTDNPAVAPYILQHFNNLAAKQNTKEFQIKRLNVAMADLLVYEMPQNLTTLTDAIAYWQKIVNETKGKSKDDLIRAAMKRAKIKLPNTTLESVANVDSIATQMPKLVQNTPVLAVNLHRVAERTLHSHIPQSRPGSRQYVGSFEKWWETNKSLYQPKRLVNNANYDRYKSFFRPKGFSAGVDDENDGDAITKQPSVKSNAAPAKPKAKKPHNPKGGKTIDNTAAVLLKNAK